MRHWNEPFVFQKPNAWSRVSPRYTPKQLAEVRRRLSRFGRRELKSQLRAPLDPRHPGEQTELQRILVSGSTPVSYAVRAATAHVLLERGILVGNDDRTGQLRSP